MMLAYTLNRTLTEQAVVERDRAADDEWGADSRPDWQYLSTIPCRLWWDKTSGARGANREYVSPARTVAVSLGGMIMALGTDITERDRIVQVNTFDQETGLWVELIAGVFEVVGAINQFDHMEISVNRPHLGA